MKVHLQMKSIIRAVSWALATTGMSIALATPVFAAEQAWVTKSNDNANLLLKVMGKYAPERAGNMGVDGLDEQITDMSRDHFAIKTKETRAVIAQLQK